VRTMGLAIAANAALLLAGIRVHDRTAPGRPELLGLCLAELGRAGSLAPVEAGVVAHEGDRVGREEVHARTLFLGVILCAGRTGAS